MSEIVAGPEAGRPLSDEVDDDEVDEEEEEEDAEDNVIVPTNPRMMPRRNPCRSNWLR